jgi:hypothetical protein
MGIVEISFGPIIKKAIENNQMEILLRKMALIIDRQALALRSMEWHKESVERAAREGELLFDELKEMEKDV